MSFQLPPITEAETRRLLNNPDFKPFALKKYENWMVYLREDQRYLGRAYAWLTTRHVDFMGPEQLTAPERDELWDTVVPDHRRMLDKLFKPTLMNYCWLGNEHVHHRGHAHLHMIPRYATPPTFMHVAYPDERFGHNYAPYEKLPLDMEQIGQLRLMLLVGDKVI